jgi:glycosyltransferase involved in cell wall biosynthesis
MLKHRTINVDHTHVGRRASGIERIAIEQFNNEALSPLKIRTFTASGKRSDIVLTQMVKLPLHALKHRSDIYVFPGFPPSPYFSAIPDRSVLFVHDLFLLTRRADLNRIAKYYMAPLFHIAVKRFRYFLTNSEDTATKLATVCNPAASILTYRPRIRNVFALAPRNRSERLPDPAKLRVVAMGTIEPRKNFMAAVEICQALARRLGREVELHIIGRYGWGVDVKRLESGPNVILHGYVSDANARHIIDAADLMLCTSHDEGLCLPLIEVQYGGLPVAAPNEGVFREVLGTSGILLDSRSPESVADQIASNLMAPGWRYHYATASVANVVRWNGLAEKDREEVIQFLSTLGSLSNPESARQRIQGTVWRHG